MHLKDMVYFTLWPFRPALALDEFLFTSQGSQKDD